MASSSPRRRELLIDAGFTFGIIASDAPELHDEQLTARELSLLNSHRKARAVAKQHPDALVIGADTLVALGARLYGKPADKAEAQRMLRELKGTTHQVVTGVSLIHLRSGRESLFAEKTDVTFRDLSDAQIDEYISRVQTLDKAGSYAIQEEGDRLVENIEGSFSNVVGLPIERVEAELKKFGVHSYQESRAFEYA